jgi:uncharacterized protein (TIGR03086 family)
MPEDDLAARHLRVCARFGDAVAGADGNWDKPSPCAGWDARAVIEHVIGFHDVLLLRPLRAKPQRPRDDPVRRWALTYDVLQGLLARRELFEDEVEIPPVGNNPATRLDLRQLVPALSQDVLVHTWDLARAVGADDRLDRDLCEHFYGRLPADPESLARSGMFGHPIALANDADVQSKLLARLGRDPNWRAP